MASLDSLRTRKLLAEGTAIQAYSDGSVALRLIPLAAAGAVTSVTVVTATSVAIITANGGTDTYLFSSYATMGALADEINADGMFQAKVLDVLRSAASNNNILAAALTASNATDEAGNLVWDLYTDSSAFKQIGVCLSSTRGFDMPENRRVHLQEISYTATLGNAAANMVQVWARKDGVERQIMGILSVSGTLTAVTFASGEGKITSKENESLIVIVKDSASLADGGNVRVTGIIE